MAATLTTEQVDKLSVDEKLKLLQIVWDSLAAEGANLPTPDWQRKLVRERVEEFRRDPNRGTDAFEFLATLGQDE